MTSAAWNCLSETADARVAGSGTELEVGVATQQAQRAQQGEVLATAALAGGTLCVSVSNALNNMAKMALTVLSEQFGGHYLLVLASASSIFLTYFAGSFLKSLRQDLQQS